MPLSLVTNLKRLTVGYLCFKPYNSLYYGGVVAHPRVWPRQTMHASLAGQIAFFLFTLGLS